MPSMLYRTRRGSCVTDNSGFGGGIADAKSVLPESAEVYMLMRKEIKTKNHMKISQYKNDFFIKLCRQTGLMFPSKEKRAAKH